MCRYRDLVCYNCGEPRHFVGICSKPKHCFIPGVPSHHKNACPAWKGLHPIVAYMGSTSQGLGFYHVEVPNLESTQWLNLTKCGVVRVKCGQISLSKLEGEELDAGKILVRFPPHKKVADIKNYPSFNLRKEGVHVEVLEWIGELDPYGELREVWIQMKGIPSRWFGMMTDVEWSTLFKSFYVTVRVKIFCRDPIPPERLFEIEKKLFLVSLLVEGEVREQSDGGTDDGNDGHDDNNDDEANDLEEEFPESDLMRINPICI
ncbi:hypothetical protein BS78_04G100100 [Paspalum vaginatum]|nr:hypothetical protein BS78_04G100100 [Paspalum vaginatum]